MLQFDEQQPIEQSASERQASGFSRQPSACSKSQLAIGT
jgi:hypothetical protein